MTCIDTKKKERNDRSNDVFDNNLIKIQYSQSQKTKKHVLHRSNKLQKKRKKERNKQTKKKFLIGLKNQ